MGSIKPPGWPSVQPQEYDAAESMLQHSRSARSSTRSNPPQVMPGYAASTMPNYGMQSTHPQLPSIATQLPSYSSFPPPFSAPGPMTHNPTFNTNDGKLSSPPDVQNPQDYSQRRSFSQENDHSRSGSGHRPTLSALSQSADRHRNSSMDDSKPTSPENIRSLDGHRPTGWTHQSSSEALSQGDVKDDPEPRPIWADQKTKAGKERKRLPLACIACRRKKIRCSGEKPACKHCTRSRMPCVYKVTTRKAAPRTDYMAMLDRRLKRMEERVIKIIPKEVAHETSAIPRAIVRPPTSGNSHGGKKRGAEEAIGAQINEWAGSKLNAQAVKGGKPEGPRAITEGSEHLPSKEIQEHLSEVFFDYLYGQSYHLMHKPSYMRRLRDGSLPPVLVLAVCAIAARFATHRDIDSEPAYLRGEEWAAPVRDIVLKRFDEPNITILTVTIILGLHEFGTCQGGRSWMFAGMATRMAHALQLHREMDHDPLGRKNGTKSELSFTDREIRRRTMWACFTMDRFTASGTERPMFADEEDIKLQLPIKEINFLQEIPGPTEDLTGAVHNPVTPDTGQASDPKANMGVAAYMIRFIALWGRVIKYLNMGGKEKDQYPIWDSKSRFADLKRQAAELKANLPPDLRNTEENLESHSAEKLANQFLFMHITSYQITLFLHRFAIPTTPGGGPPKEMPKPFLNEAVPTAIDSANQISLLLAKAFDHRTIAPFMGYCAFMSSTVHVWGFFSGNESLKSTAKQHLAENIHFLNKMKRYWGVLQFMADGLRDIYRKHFDASMKGKSEAAKEEAKILQFGDWFDRYPHGMSQTDIDEAGARIKRESATLSHKSDLQSVEEFFHTRSPPGKASQPKKPKKNPKIASQPSRKASHSQPSRPAVEHPQLQTSLPIPMPEAQPAMMPSHFATNHQLYLPPDDPYPTPTDLGPFAPHPHQGLLTQLDRQLVYNAYAGNDPSASSSALALNAMTSGADPQDFTPVSDGGMWDGSPPVDMNQQAMLMGPTADSGPFMGDMNTSAWFMPFNLNPPDLDGSYGGP